MRIGLSLSGGGVRATAFHLGVLARLADEQLLEQVTFLSSVSGGSLGVGLVFQRAGGVWPTSDAYRKAVVPRIRAVLAGVDLQRAYTWRVLLMPWLLFAGRASLLGKAIEKTWKIDGLLSDLPESPRWIINATCFETGKNFRFMRKRMGDYRTNYVLGPRFPVAQAMAASAAYPGLIGPLSLRSDAYAWRRYRPGSLEETEPASCTYPKLRLWDGGVYDNLGTEALFKPTGGFRDGVDFLVVSDASAVLEAGPARVKAPVHLVRIAMDQVRSLRARTIISHFLQNPGTGVYLRMGNTAHDVFTRAGVRPPKEWRAETVQAEEAVTQAAGLPTTLRKLSQGEFELLFRHGYEVADATLVAYVPGRFKHLALSKAP